MSTNDQAGEQTGTLVERPAPESQRAGFLWTAPDETVYQVKRDPMTGAQTWQPIAGPGAAGSAAWPRYVVSSQPDPPAAYATIGAAVAAAVAAGHGVDAPAVVLIHPGSYAESVALPGGIELVGLSGVFACTITGDVTIAGAAGGRTTLQLLTIAGRVVFAQDQGQLVINRVVVQPDTGDAITVQGTTPGNTQLVLLSGAGLAGAGVALNVTSPCQVTAEVWTGFGATRAAILNGQAQFFSGQLGGGVEVVAGAVALSEVRVQGDPPFTLHPGTTASMSGGSYIPAPGGPIATGQADFYYSEIAGETDDAPRVDAATTVHPRRNLRGFTRRTFSGAGPFTYAGDDVSYIDPTAPAVFGLPPASTSPEGLRILVKASGAFAVTVTPDGADAIDGAPAWVLAAGPTRPVVLLQRDTEHGGWSVLGATP